MILVTGATGHLGSAVIDQLLKKNSPNEIAGLARSEDKAQTLRDKGIQVHVGDLDDVPSLQKALQNIDKVLLISTVDNNRYQQHKNLIDSAKVAGLKHIAYTSALIRDVNSSVVKAHLESHFKTEEYIKKSGLSYSIFRNSLYTDMIPIYVGKEVFEKGIYLPTGKGKVAYALRREMGEAIANILLQTDEESRIYELTGSEMYSYKEVADCLSEIAGETVPYIDADPSTYPEILKQSGVPERMIVVASGFTTDIRNRQYEIVSANLKQLLGREPKNLSEALKEIYSGKI